MDERVFGRGDGQPVTGRSTARDRTAGTRGPSAIVQTWSIDFGTRISTSLA